MLKKISVFLIIKFIFDLSFAIFLVVFLLPLFFLISILIFFEDGLPIIFKQKRIGLEGKNFMMYKFRSMKNNTELLEDRYYCYEGDTRITKIGKFLRKYSLDELPQIINILKLEMSFIGPRPAIHDELEYEIIDKNLINVIKLRTKVKPGITGYAQVKSRNDLTWNDKLKLDKVYMNMNEKNRFFTDFLIIFFTIKEILDSKGVYDKR